MLNATAAGTAVVRATIVNGTAAGTNYTHDFSVTVTGGSRLPEGWTTVQPSGSYVSAYGTPANAFRSGPVYGSSWYYQVSPTANTYNQLYTVPQVSLLFVLNDGWELNYVGVGGTMSGSIQPGQSFFLGITGGSMVYSFRRIPVVVPPVTPDPVPPEDPAATVPPDPVFGDLWPEGFNADLPDGIVIDMNGTVTLPPNETGVITFQNGTEAEVSGGAVIAPDGTITLPRGGDALVTTAGGTEIELPGGAVIKPDGAIILPAGGAALVATSQGNVDITVTGGMKIESDGSITLSSGASGEAATITTTGETKIVLLSGGTIIEGDEAFTSELVSVYAAQFLAAELSDISETLDYLFIHVGPDGAEITYSDGDSEIVHGYYVIRVNPDGGINITEGVITLDVKQNFANGNYYFAPVDLLGPDYEYKIISRPGTSGGRAPVVNNYGRFVFSANAHQVMPMNISRAGVYIVKAIHQNGGIVAIRIVVFS